VTDGPDGLITSRKPRRVALTN